MKRLIALLLSLAVLGLPAEARRVVPPMAVAGGGATNNVALVGTNKVGSVVNSGSTVDVVLPSSVVSGNTVIIGTAFWGADVTFSAGMVTKTAGTATIGTVVKDVSHDDPSAGTADSATAIWRVPITGSGTLTLTINPAVGSGIFMVAGAAEFTGFNASPLGPASTATGTGTAHSTGTITTTVPGVIFYVGTELAAGDFTRTYSDTLLSKVDTASSTFTGILQYKITSGLSNTLTDTTGSDSSLWNVSYVQYKTN